MNGVVIIDKPPGLTSHDVVAGIRRVLGIRKIGHAGTLDPSATGVLPICIKEATKLVPFFEHHHKDYRATMRLGIRTDTLDLDGQIISEETPSDDPSEVVSALQGFVGKITQVPPRFSAVKYHGRPLYEWSRKGIEVELFPRTVEIFNITIERFALPDVTFHVSCSKGTYIRSLCADVGEKLGCGACLTSLRRTANGPFMERSALTLEGLATGQQRQLLSEGLIRPADALPDMPEIEVDSALQAGLKTGHQPTLDVMRGYDIPFLAGGDMIKLVSHGRDLVAIAKALYASEVLPSMTENIQIFQLLRVFNED